MRNPSLTRRKILGVDSQPTTAHIASLLVQAWPAMTTGVERHLNRIPGIETHARGRGKLVVTVEAATDAQLVDLVGAIEAADGVIAASLVYHELEEADHG